MGWMPRMQFILLKIHVVPTAAPGLVSRVPTCTSSFSLKVSFKSNKWRTPIESNRSFYQESSMFRSSEFWRWASTHDSHLTNPRSGVLGDRFLQPARLPDRHEAGGDQVSQGMGPRLRHLPEPGNALRQGGHSRLATRRGLHSR